MSFLEQLPLSEQQKNKIEALGVVSPMDLLARLYADPKDMCQYLDVNSVQDIANALEALLPSDQVKQLQQSPPRFALGAMQFLTPLPSLRTPDYDITTRDALFAELQHLRQYTPATHTTQERISQLEQQLNTMLDRASNAR